MAVFFSDCMYGLKVASHLCQIFGESREPSANDVQMGENGSERLATSAQNQSEAILEQLAHIRVELSAMKAPHSTAEVQAQVIFV